MIPDRNSFFIITWGCRMQTCLLYKEAGSRDGTGKPLIPSSGGSMGVEALSFFSDHFFANAGDDIGTPAHELSPGKKPGRIFCQVHRLAIFPDNAVDILIDQFHKTRV